MIVFIALLVVGGAATWAGSADEGVEVATEDVDPTPRGVHLSWVEDPSTTMTVTWFTDGTDPGSTVQWASTCAELSDEATRASVEGSSSTLTREPSVHVHEATMTGFSPGESFAYRVGSSSGGFSDCFETETAPDSGPVEIALYGDQGLGRSAQDVHDRVNATDPDLVMIAGDLAYGENDPQVWDDWFAMNQDIFAETPMMSSPGNHETYSDADPPTASYEERLAQPGAELYYSFDYVNTHFLVIMSETPDATGRGYFQDMVEFAEEDLAEAYEAKQAGEIDHIFVIQHHPLYSNTQRAGRWLDADMASWEEQLFHRYDVSMLLAGHNHNYERSYPMAYQAPTDLSQEHYEDAEGWIQIISGGGGRGLYSFKHPDDFLPYSAAHEHTHHHTNIEIDGEVVEVAAERAQFKPGEIFDSFTWVDTGAPAQEDLVEHEAHGDEAHPVAR